jgi:type IV pilus assembly protein PilB
MKQGGKLGEMLVERGKLTPDQLEDALERHQRSSGKRLGQLLIELELITEKDLVECLAAQLGLPHVWLRKGLIDPHVVDLIPKEKAELYQVIAMFRVGDDLTVAMSDPQSLFVIDQLTSLTGCRIQPVVCRQEEIQQFIREYYGKTVEMEQFLSSLDEADVELVTDRLETDITQLEEMAEGSPIINLANVMILNAIKDGASDIHVEPDDKVLRVRYRVDGVLHEVMTHRKDVHAALVSRIKVMAGLDIGERRRPQEGRIHVVADGREIDLRVSSLPTILGEKIVLRILDKKNSIVPLPKLGFAGTALETFRWMLAQPYGMILVTGPTGSGKTTTLYSALAEISTIEKNIITIEDPVEYQLPLISQVQVNERTDLSFANILRQVLRQDPDIVMVGEIRDRETAEIAIQAALTGHLVISTLHTNDSAGAVTRLVDMGIEPFLISSALTGVIAQRLARRVCEDCVTSFIPSAELLERIGWPWKKHVTFHKGSGCKTCYDSGYKGRVGLYEMLIANRSMKKAILANATLDELRQVRAESGLPSLRLAGFERARNGVTTVEEVMRVVCVEDTSDVANGPEEPEKRPESAQPPPAPGPQPAAREGLPILSSQSAD